MRSFLSFVFVLIVTSCTGQRLGSAIQRDVPDTVYFVLNDYNHAQRISTLYNESKSLRLKLKAIEVDSFLDSVKNEDLAFIFPVGMTGKNKGSYLFAFSFGNPDSHLHKMEDDGTFIPDWNLSLVDEIPVRKDWFNSDACVYYIRALESLWVEGQSIREVDIKEMKKEGYRMNKLDRICFTANYINPIFNKPGKFNILVTKGLLYQDVEEFLREEDVFDQGTVLFDTFEFMGKNQRVMYSMVFGMIYFESLELHPDFGYTLSGEQIKKYAKAGFPKS